MENINKWHNEIIGEKVVKALKENYFDAIYFEKKEDAAKYILDNVKIGANVGFGGSVTVQELDIKDKIKKMDTKILDHGDSSLTPEEKLNVKRAQLTSDLFLCSSNAITMNGELVNIDGAGNRVAAMTFGPKKVIVVAGINKIVTDEKSAFERIEVLAAPKNTKRLSKSTPCTKTGVCMNCKNEDRICRIYSVIKRKPMGANMTVVIIGEEMGY
ncbi:lactate utilization protein [Clostridium massiliodielmoense]|uniref:lactate utilization protein n=1 Tax=Clostridium massiliodielmoense TaxID=1776385 RepID=UPI0002E0D727|nr:lactate utilization protein [Clostridium massiliodielmoense]KEH97871.1 lactate utilization protein C [Clostridium botulinum C/D str. BKT12695]NEZ50187.1 lactate utilization protein [Clostridium botulinum]